MKLQFSIDKHSLYHVYWLKRDIYESLKTNEYLNQGGHKNWKIIYRFPRAGQSIKDEERVKKYDTWISRGDIIQPIVAIDNNGCIDGVHKATALEKMGYTKVPTAVSVGKGTGEVVKDEVYQPLVEKLIIDTGPLRRTILCMNCAKEMKVKGKDIVCECGASFYYAQELMGWAVPNLQTS